MISVLSFPRRRESSYSNAPSSGQSRNVAALRAIYSIDWIPAYAGMTGV